MSALIGILIILAILIFVEGIHRLTEPGLGRQLPQLILGRQEGARSQSFIEKHILPSAPVLTQRFDFLRSFSEPEKISNQLEYAGRPYGMDTGQFFGFQIFMAIVGLIAGGIYATFGIIIGGCGGPVALILLPIGGFFYPRFWLSRRVKIRQEDINLSMPDLLDMLAISVQAGMGFDNALRLVTKRMDGPMGEEVRRLIREMEMGEPRAVAFRRLIERNTSEDLRSFIDALLQAEELGTPIARTLEIQAGELRKRRINRARERAAKASPQISLVTVFVLVPAVMCLFITMLILGIFVGGELGMLTP